MMTFGKAKQALHPVRKPVKGLHPHMQVYWEAPEAAPKQVLAQKDTLAPAHPQKKPALKLGEKVRAIPMHAAPNPDPKPAEKKVIRLKGRQPHASERASDPTEAKRKVAVRLVMERAKKAREKPESKQRHLAVLGKLLDAAKKQRFVNDENADLIVRYALGQVPSMGMRQFIHDPSTDLNDLLKDEEMRSALALIAGNADPFMLTPKQVKKLEGAGIFGKNRELNDFGRQVVGTFRTWLERQSANLQTLVGSGETKRAEYYVPEELRYAEGRIVKKRPLGHAEKGVQDTYHVTFETPENKRFDAIYKPADGEADERPGAIDPGTCYRRERAAYEIDQLLGLNVVPPVVIRKISNVPGSVQEWKANCETAFEAGGDSWTVEADPMDVYGIAVLDYITQNTDRHTGNFLVDRNYGRPENKLWAIDHGYSLPHDADLGVAYYLSEPHRYLTDVNRLKLPKEMISRLSKIDPGLLKAKLSRLGIEETACAGAMARFRQIVTTKKLPEYAGRDMW